MSIPSDVVSKTKNLTETQQEQCTQISENGVTIEVEVNHDNPSKCKTFYNHNMLINREFVLAALAVYVEERSERVQCLDAFSASGIAGLQWKHHLKATIDVTLNDVNTDDIIKSCHLNSFEITDNIFRRLVTGETIDGPASERAVQVSKQDANIMLHMRQFHFVHLDPFGSTVQFLDAAFRNVYAGGVVVLTSTDISCLYGKCPQVTRRNYDAFNDRSDYCKEAGVRIVIAAAARSAARCNKGIEVLYSVGVEHFLQVAVRLKRGAQNAGASLDHIGKILHCLKCQEWNTLPNTRALSDTKDYILCDCTTEDAQTVIELGPMWRGNTCNTEFLTKMKTKSQELKLSERISKLLQTIILETQCPSTSTIVTMPNGSKTFSNGSQSANQQESCNKEDVTISANHEKGCKRPLDTSNGEGDTSGNCKRLKRTRKFSDDETPMFFYNLHKRKIKATLLPKIEKCVEILRQKGYRTSRTHFDPQGLKTNLLLSELVDILHELRPQT